MKFLEAHILDSGIFFSPSITLIIKPLLLNLEILDTFGPAYFSCPPASLISPKIKLRPGDSEIRKFLPFAAYLMEIKMTVGSFSWTLLFDSAMIMEPISRSYNLFKNSAYQ